MKRAALLIIISALIFPLAGESGEWIFEPIFTRLPDDTLIPPGREYSIPFKGLEELHFVDDYMIRVLAAGEVFRAFYEYLPGEADNMVLELSFRDGRTLKIQTSPVSLPEGRRTSSPDDTKLFFYRLPEGFFSSSMEELEDERGADSGTSGSGEEIPKDYEMEDGPVTESPEMAMGEDADDSDRVVEGESEENPSWSISGYLRKKQDYMQKTGIEKK